MLTFVKGGLQERLSLSGDIVWRISSRPASFSTLAGDTFSTGLSHVKNGACTAKGYVTRAGRTDGMNPE